jgi:hypothetical protein
MSLDKLIVAFLISDVDVQYIQLLQRPGQFAGNLCPNLPHPAANTSCECTACPETKTCFSSVSTSTPGELFAHSIRSWYVPGGACSRRIRSLFEIVIGFPSQAWLAWDHLVVMLPVTAVSKQLRQLLKTFSINLIEAFELCTINVYDANNRLTNSNGHDSLTLSPSQAI